MSFSAVMMHELPGAEIESVVAAVVLQNILDAGAMTSYYDLTGFLLGVTRIYQSLTILNCLKLMNMVISWNFIVLYPFSQMFLEVTTTSQNWRYSITLAWTKSGLTWFSCKGSEIKYNPISSNADGEVHPQINYVTVLSRRHEVLD